MKPIEQRISDAYYQTAMCVGKYPKRLFLGKHEVALLKEFSDKAFTFIMKDGTVPAQKLPSKLESIMGMTIHETSDETLIATGWDTEDAP